MHCVAMEDPGLAVLPTHRLFRGVPSLKQAELIEKLGDCFTSNDAGQGPDRAHAIWEEIETEGDQGTLAFYTKADDRWTIVQIADPGRERMAAIAQEHGDDWRGLGVSLLHRLIIGELLGQTDLPKPKYVHLVDEVVEGCKTDEFPLAALVMPATVEDIKKISLAGERMPAKSTYFYPKLLSGLVINPLE